MSDTATLEKTAEGKEALEVKPGPKIEKYFETEAPKGLALRFRAEEAKGQVMVSFMSGEKVTEFPVPAKQFSEGIVDLLSESVTRFDSGQASLIMRMVEFRGERRVYLHFTHAERPDMAERRMSWDEATRARALGVGILTDGKGYLARPRRKDKEKKDQKSH